MKSETATLMFLHKNHNKEVSRVFSYFEDHSYKLVILNNKRLREETDNNWIKSLFAYFFQLH